MRGDVEEALTDIDESIMEDPYNAWAYRNKGLYYLKTRNADEAMRLLSRALEMSDFLELTHYYLGEAWLLKGDKAKACEFFQKAFERKEITTGHFRRRCGGER